MLSTEPYIFPLLSAQYSALRTAVAVLSLTDAWAVGVYALPGNQVLTLHRQTFADVPPPNPFWTRIEELAAREIIAGYACGRPGEPCDPAQRPYFRWGTNTTRGQPGKTAA